MIIKVYNCSRGPVVVAGRPLPRRYTVEIDDTRLTAEQASELRALESYDSVRCSPRFTQPVVDIPAEPKETSVVRLVPRSIKRVKGAK
jgi:hypothetical protein